MPATIDMTSYVTRTELDRVEKKIDQRFEQLERKFAPYGSLEAFGIALIDRMDRMEQRWEQRFVQMEQHSERRHQQLLQELSRHVGAANDELQRRLGGFEDKYASLPARVDRLEAAVFPPKRRRRR